MTVTYRLSSDEYRRLVLWQYLHRDDVPSIPTAVRHLLNRQLPDDLVILRRKLVEDEGGVDQDDDVEPLPVGTLRSVPPAIPDDDRGVSLRVGLLEDEHLRLTLWGLEHAGCLETTELGPAVRHLVMLSLADEDLVVGRRKKPPVPVPVATPAYDEESLRRIRLSIGLSAEQSPPSTAAA